MTAEWQADICRQAERRRRNRLPVIQTVQIQYPAGPQLASIRDLSLDGIGVVMEHPPPYGTRVNIALGIDEDRRLDLLSVVTRLGELVGFRFADLTAAETAALGNFIYRHLF